ncbi:MAG: DMT family transporter [Rubritepida sp.]|nr:DMT family transporter [Rubritepida sp.]
MAMMAGAALCFSGMGVCYRLALEEGLPTPAAPFARGLFTLLILIPWIARQGIAAAFLTRRPWLMTGRCAAGLVSFQSWMLALVLLPLADAVAIAQARPLWAIPLAALFLHERIRRDRVLAALVGFCGVLIIAQPGGALSWGVPAAVLAGVGGAMVFITIKLLSTTEPPMRVIAWYALSSLVIWGPVCAWLWVTPSWGAVALLLLGSLWALGGDWLASNAARRAEAGLLSPMEYIQIPAGALFGWLVFAELPGEWLPVGVALMLAATVYLARAAGRQA